MSVTMLLHSPRSIDDNKSSATNGLFSFCSLAVRLQKEREARTAALEAKIEHARARVREKYSREN